jgi:hypothetical protein
MRSQFTIVTVVVPKRIFRLFRCTFHYEVPAEISVDKMRILSLLRFTFHYEEPAKISVEKIM